MGSDRLDRFIKGKVQNHETASDTDLLWQKIQAKQVAKKKDKRRFFFLWFFTGILLISSGLGLFFYANSSTEDATTLNTLSPENNDPILASTSLPGPNSESKVIAIDSKTKENDLNLKNKNNHSTKEALKKSNDLLKTKIISDGSTTLASFDQLSPELKESLSKSNTLKKVSSTEPNELKNLETSGVNNDNDSNQIRTDKIVIKSEFTTLATLPLQFSKIDYSNPFDQFEKEKDDFPKPTDSRQYNFATELFFNYGMVDKTLTSNNEAYLKIRDSLETPMDVISVGLNFRIQHKSNFYLKTGLEYQQINERFQNYSTWDSTIIAPDQIIAITYDMDGSSTNTIGDGLVDETYFASKKIYNRYRSIELPLLVGYASSERRLNWFAEGGLALNLRFKPDGEIPDESGNSILLKEDQSYFKSRTGLSLVSAVGLSYQLTDQFSLSAAPNFKYQLGSVSSELNPVDQKYFTFGLRLGLGYHW